MFAHFIGASSAPAPPRWWLLVTAEHETIRRLADAAFGDWAQGAEPPGDARDTICTARAASTSLPRTRRVAV